jgi:hypothetical protein
VVFTQNRRTGAGGSTKLFQFQYVTDSGFTEMTIPEQMAHSHEWFLLSAPHQKQNIKA